ncbi:MAG: PBP1A family penicillin-binding protein [Bacilli bacterium]|nr:PBP1A family penicillin-binding protein [Bacilli bacterium]
MVKNYRKLIILFSTLIIIVIIISYSRYYIKHDQLPDISDLNTIEFYSIDGQKYFELNNKTSTYVKLEEISDYLKKAIIAVEDRHFYEHHGFDYLRIGKAILDNLKTLSRRYGASTITQQYARNLYLTHEKSWERKLREAYYTILLEMNYSKDDILEGYLNTIYFGHGVYGIHDASIFYFNKQPNDLTLGEAAVLAAIPKGPTYYSPLKDYERNKERKELILKLMLEQGKITETEYRDALNEDIKIIGKHPKNVNNIAPYFLDIVIKELESYNLLNNPYINGLKVYTTLDLTLNEISLKAINTIYPSSSLIETSVFASDPQTGYVKTVIGGRDYQVSQFNRAINGYRHPGSTIKPLLYYAALEHGFTPTTTFKSEPTTFYINKGKEKYEPTNFQNIYAYRDVTMAYALAVSDNIYAIKTHLFLGESTLIKMAKRMGINTTNMKPVPSLALGATEIKLSELTTAYAYFASMGKQVAPVYITKITDLNDEVLYEYKNTSKQILNRDLCFIMNELLRGMFDPYMSYNQSVTGLSIIPQLTHTYAGKSGTTDYDTTMIGYNPELVVGVWTGYDELIPLTTVSERNYAKRVWAKIMEDYFSIYEATWYKPTKNVSPVIVNPITGEMNNKGYHKVLYFLKGTEPYYYY